MNVRKVIGLTTLVVGLAQIAPAAPITLVGGTAGSIPGGATNEYISAGLFAGPSIDGFYGSQININVAIIGILTAEFFGAEAGFTNTFELNGTPLFTHDGTANQVNIASDLNSPLATGGDFVLPGILPFRFVVDTGGGLLSVDNGSNPDDSAGLADGPNFFARCESGGSDTECNSVFLFLDDSGSGPDDNHDDLLVKLTVLDQSSENPIPEPGTFALMGGALVAVFVASRRLRQ